MTSYRAEFPSHRHIVRFTGPDGGVNIDDRDCIESHTWLHGSDQRLHIILEGRSYDFRVEDGDESAIIVTYAGHRYRCHVTDERFAKLADGVAITATEKKRSVIKAPMPGLVVKVLVRPGEAVSAGQCVLVLEAMKMENNVKAQRQGIVQSVSVAAGDVVEAGVAMIVVE